MDAAACYDVNGKIPVFRFEFMSQCLHLNVWQDYVTLASQFPSHGFVASRNAGLLSFKCPNRFLLGRSWSDISALWLQ